MQLSWLVTGPTGLLTLLLLQDKKRRQYLITALADTKVDYKGEGVAYLHTHHPPAPLHTHSHPPLTCPPLSPFVHAVLSARLGLGKGGLQQGSEELLVEALQVGGCCLAGGEEGCVWAVYM